MGVRGWKSPQNAEEAFQCLTQMFVKGFVPGLLRILVQRLSECIELSGLQLEPKEFGALVYADLKANQKELAQLWDAFDPDQMGGDKSAQARCIARLMVGLNPHSPTFIAADHPIPKKTRRVVVYLGGERHEF